MEAIRPARTDHPPQDVVLSDQLDELPPPPQPFPVELLPATSSAMRTDLSSLQSSCVSALSSLLPAETDSIGHWSISPDDQQLAAALTELLEVSYELETFRPPDYSTPSGDQPVSSNLPPIPLNAEASLAALESHLTDLQASASQRMPPDGHGVHIHPAINVVREELAWDRVDTLSRAIQHMIQRRNESVTPTAEAASLPLASSQSTTSVEQPPEYTRHETSAQDDLPSYSGDHTLENSKDIREDTSEEASRVSAAPTSEKMLHELEAVTNAIERLAPRFQDQRMDMPAASSSRSAVLDDAVDKSGRRALEKQKMKELEEIWDRIERAHGKRKVRDDQQRVTMDGAEESRKVQRERFLQSLYDQAEGSRMQGQDSALRDVDRDLARARDLRDDRFLRNLIERSADGRLADQDSHAPLDPETTRILDLIAKSDSAQLSSQKSIMRLGNSALRDPNELVSLRDFFQSSAPEEVDNTLPCKRSRAATEASLPPEQKEGTLSKIKGLMKRRSSGFGLPNGSHLAIADLAYICEYQERISSIDIRIHTPSAPQLKETLLLEPDQSSEDHQDVMINLKGSDPLRIRLPTRSSPFAPIPIEAHDTYLRAKLRTDSSTCNRPTATPFHIPPLPASELRALKPTVLSCAVCDQNIANLGPTSTPKGNHPEHQEVTWKDLPSEHWAEMMEVWMCHSDPTFTARLTKHTENGFWPSRGIVLVGGSYLLIHPDNISSGLLVEENPFPFSLSPDYKKVIAIPQLAVAFLALALLMADRNSRKFRSMSRGKGTHERRDKGPHKLFWLIQRSHINHRAMSWEATAGATCLYSPLLLTRWYRQADHQEDWQIVKCQCGEVLGKQRSADGRPGEGTLRISKWALAFRGAEEKEGSAEAIRLPLSVFVVSDMLELLQAHASHHFVVVNEESQERRLLMWLWNPSMRISWKRGSHTSLHPTLEAEDVCNAAKIFYKVLDPSSEDIAHLSGFSGKSQVETLAYSSQVGDRLIAVLAESTMLYPIPERTMGKFDVGFLRKAD